MEAITILVGNSAPSRFIISQRILFLIELTQLKGKSQSPPLVPMLGILVERNLHLRFDVLQTRFGDLAGPWQVQKKISTSYQGLIIGRCLSEP